MKAIKATYAVPVVVPCADPVGAAAVGASAENGNLFCIACKVES